MRRAAVGVVDVHPANAINIVTGAREVCTSRVFDAVERVTVRPEKPARSGDEGPGKVVARL